VLEEFADTIVRLNVNSHIMMPSKVNFTYIVEFMIVGEDKEN